MPLFLSFAALYCPHRQPNSKPGNILSNQRLMRSPLCAIKTFVSVRGNQSVIWFHLAMLLIWSHQTLCVIQWTCWHCIRVQMSPWKSVFVSVMGQWKSGLCVMSQVTVQWAARGRWQRNQSIPTSQKSSYTWEREIIYNADWFYNENKTSGLTQWSTVTTLFPSLPPHPRSAIGKPNLQMEGQDQVRHLTKSIFFIWQMFLYGEKSNFKSELP